MIKYVHIFYCDGVNIAVRVAEMLYDEENNFEPSEHLFVTNHKRIYEKMKEKYNIEYANPKYPATLINIYAPKCEWIICHSMPLVHNNLFINPKYLKKIIWRTWGHDAGYVYQEGKYIKNCVKKICECIWRKQVRSFQTVGFGNMIDVIDISNRFGTVKTNRMPYPRKNDEILELLENQSFQKSDSKYRILLGHSGFSNDNHIEVLKKLSRFYNENLEIYLVLSYGNPLYIDNVRHYIKEKNIKNVNIIDEYMQIEEYVALVSNMDIAIFDGKKSYALGNISWLLKCQKKIFLNRDGVIKKAFEMEGIPHHCTDEIENMTYEEFIAPLNYGKLKTDMCPYTYGESVEAWENLFLGLSKK